MSKYPWPRYWTPKCSWCWNLELQPLPLIYEYVCEWVNVTGVVKCFEWSVDGKSFYINASPLSFSPCNKCYGYHQRRFTNQNIYSGWMKMLMLVHPTSTWSDWSDLLLHSHIQMIQSSMQSLASQESVTLWLCCIETVVSDVVKTSSTSLSSSLLDHFCPVSCEKPSTPLCTSFRRDGLQSHYICISLKKANFNCIFKFHNSYKHV